MIHFKKKTQCEPNFAGMHSTRIKLVPILNFLLFFCTLWIKLGLSTTYQRLQQGHVLVYGLQQNSPCSIIPTMIMTAKRNHFRSRWLPLNTRNERNTFLHGYHFSTTDPPTCVPVIHSALWKSPLLASNHLDISLKAVLMKTYIERCRSSLLSNLRVL